MRPKSYILINERKRCGLCRFSFTFSSKWFCDFPPSNYKELKQKVDPLLGVCKEFKKDRILCKNLSLG